MNIFSITRAYISFRPLTTFVNILLLSVGIATIAMLMLFGDQLREAMLKNAAGFDVIVGAKGSPLQLILSTVYQADVPTGNIPKSEYDKLLTNPAVRSAIPMALGDSYHGFRIVGTTTDYINHYAARTSSGRTFKGVLEVVLGADVAKATKLGLGATFPGSHGLTDGGEVHDKSPYTVVGVLERSGTVLDRLILTPVESVWAVHEQEHAGEAPGSYEEEDEEEEAPGGERAITAALISYSSPAAAIMFPRFVNTMTPMQAASPAVETTRLLQVVGFGFDTLRLFGMIVCGCAAFSVFVGLYQALSERRYDLAVMRTFGISRARLCGQVILEGVIVSFIAGLLGIVLAHTGLEIISRTLISSAQLTLSGLRVVPEEGFLLLASIGVGFLAALLPAYQAYRTDIAQTLARG